MGTTGRSPEAPESAEPTRGPIPVPALIAWVLALLLALPYVRGTVDDVYITLAYAAEWLASGSLRWTTGEIVEGYSNFGWLLLLLPFAAVPGVDPVVVAKGLGAMFALAWLLWLARQTRDVPVAWLPLAAVSAWAPFAYWMVSGLETVAFGAALAVGWASCASGRWRSGIAGLGAAALLHPEGHAYLLAAVAAWAPRGRRSADARAALASVLVGLGVYHAWRVAHFGAVWPTPYLVKLAGPEPSWDWAAQLAREAVTLAGIVAAVVVSVRPNRTAVGWVSLPLLLQAALLLRAGGDWMGWARFLLPGVMAAVSAALVAWPARSAPPRWGVVAAVLTVAGAAALAPRPEADGGLGARDLPTWAETTALRRHGHDIPLAHDLAWVVENVPDGHAVMTTDVGILGHVPGVAVRDAGGLVDREVAEFRASRRPFVVDAWAPRYGPAPGQIAFVRVSYREGQDPPVLEPWLSSRLPHTADVGGAFRSRWFAATPEKPAPATVRARWQHLAARFPASGWLRERAATARRGQSAAP